MHQWSVGDIDVVRVEDTNFALPAEPPVPEWMVPHFAPGPGELRLAFSALAVRAGSTRIVIDPWLADDGPRNRADAASHATALLGELAAAGFAADEVDVVVNSHVDGVGWNTRPAPDGRWVPSFPSARYLYPADELAAVDRGEVAADVDALDVLTRAGVREGVSLPCEVAPGVSLVDAPGHNAGHAAVRIEQGDALAIVPGHLILSAWQVHDPAADLGDGAALALATATRRAMLDELADRGGLLLTTLIGGPGGGRVRRRSGGPTASDRGAGFWLEVADQEGSPAPLD